MTRPAVKQQPSEGIHRDRHRHQAGPSRRRRVRRGPGARLRRILDLKSLPSSMVVVGAGVIGIEYASMFAALGTKVTVVEKRDSMLDFCDPEVVEALKFHLRDLAVTFRFGEEVTAVDVGRGHRHDAGQRQADPRGDGDVLGGPPGPDRAPRRGKRRAGDRQPGADLRRRPVPDEGRPHLRRRRRDRLPRAGRHSMDQAGSPPTTPSASR